MSAVSAIRVLIVVENSAVPRDRRVWNESLTLRDAGYDVHVIAPVGHDERPGSQTLNGITVHRHWVPRNAGSALGYLAEYLGTLLWEFVLAARIWRSRRFDLIHLCNPPDTLFLVALPFRIMGVSILFDHHDLVPELLEVKFGRRPWLRRVALALERVTYSVADVTVAVNESYRQLAITRGHQNAADVFVVRNGPDLTRMPALDALPAGRSPKTRWVGYVGEIGTQDGLEILVEVAREIVRVRGRNDVYFRIIGDGPDLGRVQRLAEHVGLSTNVEFTGYLSGDELWRALGACDVCVCPDPMSDYNNVSTMIKTMEYMALAKPIVQFDLHEGRVSAGDAALYAQPGSIVDFADKVLELVDDRERASAMGMSGRSRIEASLSWNRQAPVLLQAYEHALHPRRHA